MTDKGPKNTAQNAASQEIPIAKDQRTGHGPMEVSSLDSLSKTQRVVLRWLSSNRPVQIAGHSAAPYLSAARSLVRKGLAYTHRTGWYGITDQGRVLIDKAPSVEPDGTPHATHLITPKEES